MEINNDYKAVRRIMNPSVNRRNTFSCAAVFLVLFLFLPHRASGQEANIRDILVTPQGGQILVYARVTNCFTTSMESAIMAGLPTTFTFLLNLYQERSGWLDSKVASAEVKNTIKYDSVKKTFYVYSSMERDPAIFQDLESAKRAMSEFNGAIVFPKSVVRKDLPHYIMMMAKLDKVRLPLHMEYVFFFVSLWDFETAWYRQHVTF
jgi:hypothetical protein